MKVIGQFHAPASLSHRKKSWYILYKRVDISQSQGGCFRTGENPMSVLGLKPWIFPPIAYKLSCLQTVWTGFIYLLIYLCIYLFLLNWDLNSLVSITTHYSKKVLGFKPQWGARFFTPFQTGPKAHPSTTTMYTAALSQGAKWWRCGVDLMPHCSAEVQQRIEPHL
jgi:hypothetical protein